MTATEPRRPTTRAGASAPALSALIDERATITIRRIARAGVRVPEFRALVRVRADGPTVEQLRATYGGSVSQERQPNGEPRPVQLWELTGPRVGALLRPMLPYLERQRDLAEMALELREIQDAQHTAPGRMLNAEHVARCELLYRHARQLARPPGRPKRLP